MYDRYLGSSLRKRCNNLGIRSPASCKLAFFYFRRAGIELRTLRRTQRSRTRAQQGSSRAPPRLKQWPLSTGGPVPLSLHIAVMECWEVVYALPTVQMAHPNQASSLQGFRDVGCDFLAVDDLGIGSGWQQSRQN